MREILQKLKSRKLWACTAGLAVAVSLILGVDGDTITKVSGAVTALASVVTYIAAEGKIDAAAVGKAAGEAQAAIEAVKDDA